MDDNRKLLDTLDVNPRSSVVVANNLVEGKKGVEGHLERNLPRPKTKAPQGTCRDLSN